MAACLNILCRMPPTGETCSTCSSSSSSSSTTTTTDIKPREEDDGLQLRLSLGRHPCHAQEPDPGRSKSNSRALSGSDQHRVAGASSRLMSSEIWHSIQGELQDPSFAPKGAPARSASLPLVGPGRRPMHRQPSLGGAEPMQRKIRDVELQEAPELQRRKELEAQRRRQEARKRRRILIEEKQLRKTRPDEARLLSRRYTPQLSRAPFNSADMMPYHGCFQSGAGRGLGRESPLPVDIKRMKVSGEEKSCEAKAGDEYTDCHATKDVADDEPPHIACMTEVNPKVADSSISTSFENFQGKQAKDNGLQSKTLASEKHTEDHESSQTLGNNSASISGAASNTSPTYAASSFPLFPIHCSVSFPSSDSTALPLQMGFSTPYFMHLLHSQYQGSKDSSDLTCSKLPSPFEFSICNGLPVPEAYIPWLCGALSQAASNPASWGKHSQSTGSGQLNSNETHSSNAELSSDSVKGNTSVTTSNCQSGCIIPKPRKLGACSLPKSGLSRTVSDSEIQLGLLQTASDSSAWLDFINNLRKSGREVHGKGNVDPFISELATCPETSQALCRSHHAIQDQAEKSETMAPLPHGEENHCMGAKGSPSHCTAVDPITPEACGSECNSGSLAVDNILEEVLNLQADLTLKGKSAEAGSFSDLHMVSTTGPGPNGRTVTGFMYIFNKNHVKIVCTCHSTHLSPSEFVQHAGYTDLSNPERNIIVDPSPWVC